MNQKLHLFKEKVRNLNWKIIIVIIILIIGIIWVTYAVKPEIFGKVIDSVVHEGINNKATVENFPEYLEKIPVINNLPKDASILISVYNNDKRYRYYIKGKNVEYLEDQQPRADIEVSFPSKYLAKLNSANFCEVAKEMNNNRDLSFKINTDKISLFWKYRDVLKYRSCLGY